MKHMIETQVAKYLGFGDDLNLDEFSRIYKLYETRPDDKPLSITMICSLLKTPSQVCSFLFLFEMLRVKTIIKHINLVRKAAQTNEIQ